MANATLSALISEFKQYGDFPFIGSDAVNRLRNVIVSVTGGAINPPLDQLGNNHTYWLSLAIQYLTNNPTASSNNSGGQIPLVQVTLGANSNQNSIEFLPAAGGPWYMFDVTDSGDTILQIKGGNPVEETSDPITGPQIWTGLPSEILFTTSLADAAWWWSGTGAPTGPILHYTFTSDNFGSGVRVEAVTVAFPDDTTHEYTVRSGSMARSQFSGYKIVADSDGFQHANIVLDWLN